MAAAEPSPRALAFAGAPELLQVQAVRSTADKVDRVEFHPVQPWLCFVDRNSSVSVWNYESDELLYDAQLGGADEAALQEAALRQRADRGAAAAGLSASAAAMAEANLTAKGTASGLVRDIKFLDMDTAFWQVARQHWLQYGAYDDRTVPYLGKYKGLQGKRWLVMACENKVVMHDLASADSRDFSRSACFESKAPTALAFLLLNLPTLAGYGTSGAPAGGAGGQPELLPVMAVGTSGGATFLINPDTMTVYAKLSGAHGKAVTAMLPLASETPGGPDMLLTASADGTIAVWDPSRTATRGPDREMAAKHSWKAHDGGVSAMTYFLCYTERPEAPVPRLATTGEDRKVHMWEVGSWKPFAKAQPLQKAVCHSIGWAPWGGTGLGLHPSLLLATGDAPLVLGLDPATGAMERYIGLDGKIDPGQKKVPKVYHLAVHPTRPHLVAAATNTGAVLLSFDTNERPPVVALPAQVVTLEALMQQTKEGDRRASEPGSKGAQGLTYVLASGGRLWSTALRMDSSKAEGAAKSVVSLASSPREAIAALDHPGRPVLACSASGRSISAVWPQLRAYAIYSLAPTGAWEVVDRGSGNNVVWSSVAPLYAVISVPNIPTAAPKKKKGFFGGSKAKAAAAAEEAAAEAEALRAAARSTTVEVHMVNEEAGSQHIVTHEVRLGGEQPVLLHGGGLLGVVLNKPHASGTGRVMQFVSWKTFSPVGPELPEPVWVSWEPECTQVALAYEHSIELCRTRPAFERFASLSVADSVAGLWQSRQLYVSTPTSVHVAFADPVTSFVQEVQLASFQGGVDGKTSPGAEATPLPPEQMRPPGPITLAGVRHSYLWLADCLGRPFLVSLRHSGLRLRCLAARGEISTARTIAERGLAAGFHDEVARFLAAMSPQEGVREALALHGLTPTAEMALSIRSGNWDRAARCFQALALGVSDKSLLQLFADGGGGGGSPLDANRITGLSLGAEGSQQAAAVAAMLDAHARNPDASYVEGLESPGTVAAAAAAAAAADTNGTGGDSSDDEAAAAAEAAAYDPVDWEAPLAAGPSVPGTVGSLAAAEAAAAPWEGEDAEAGTGATAAAAAGSGGGEAFVGAAERQRLAAVAELGLRFAEAATEAGHEDAARSALGVLVRSAHLLPPALAEQLVFRMGQCRMTESARSLAGVVAAAKAPGSLSDPAVASLLAALVGGMHGPAVQGTLQAAGLAPMAAVYSAVWGTSDRAAAVADWRRQLAAAHPEAAAAVAVAPPPA